MAISDERLTTRSASVGRLQAKWLLSVASREVNRGRVALRESAQLRRRLMSSVCGGEAGQGPTILATTAKANNTALGPRGKGCISGTQKVSPTRRDKSTRDADKGPHLLVSNAMAVGNYSSRH